MKGALDHLHCQRLIFHRLFDPNPAHVVLLNLDGVILETNSAWRQYARENHMPGSYEFVGKNYLDLCIDTKAEENSIAHRAYIGLMEVLRLKRTQFSMVYPCHSPGREQWYRLWAQPQLPVVPAIVVAHYLTRAPQADGNFLHTKHVGIAASASKTVH